MPKSFTRKNISNVPLKSEFGYSLKNIRISPVNASPDDSVIRNILNYSKALACIPAQHTGTYSLILLN